MFQVLAILEIEDLNSLENFEKQALKVAEEYSGRLIAAFESQDHSESFGLCEIHLLQFPSEKEFEAYRNDSRHLKLAALRNQAIKQTAIFKSSKTKNYG